MVLKATIDKPLWAKLAQPMNTFEVDGIWRSKYLHSTKSHLTVENIKFDEFSMNVIQFLSPLEIFDLSIIINGRIYS